MTREPFDSRFALPFAIKRAIVTRDVLENAWVLTRGISPDPAFDERLLRARDRAADLASLLIGARNLDDVRPLATQWARSLRLDLNRARGRATAHDVLSDVLRELNAVFLVAGELVRVLSWNAEGGTAGTEGPERVVLARGARRLVAVASRLLPRAERARYAEEFRAELWDLAADDVGRWRQIAYALRQLTRTWELRRELRTPQTRKASR